MRKSADCDYPIKSWEDAQNSGLDYQGWKDYCNVKEPSVAPGLSFDEDGTAYRKGYDGR